MVSRVNVESKVRKRWIVALLLVAGAAWALGGCGSSAQEQTQTGKVTLSMMVPCGIAGPLQQVVTLFEQANPDIDVETEVDNTVILARKAVDGQKSDLLFTMGPLEMDQVEAAGAIISETRRAFATNTLAVLVTADSGATIGSLADLTKPEIAAIALPDPELNTAGHYAKQALQKVGIWEKVKNKVVTPEYAVTTSSLVSSGKVDAGILYRSCGRENVSAAGAANTKIALELSTDLTPRIPVPVAVLARSAHQAEAEKFIEFLLGPSAQDVLKGYLFEAPGGESPCLAE